MTVILGLEEPAVPELLGILPIGPGGELVLPEAIRAAAGLAPGRSVLLVRVRTGGVDGLALLEPGRAVRTVDAMLRGMERLRRGLVGDSIAEEGGC